MKIDLFFIFAINEVFLTVLIGTSCYIFGYFDVRFFDDFLFHSLCDYLKELFVFIELFVLDAECCSMLLFVLTCISQHETKIYQ